MSTIDDLSEVFHMEEFDQVIITALQDFPDDPEIQRCGNMLLGKPSSFKKQKDLNWGEDEQKVSEILD